MHFANRPLLIHVEKQEGGGRESDKTQHNRSKHEVKCLRRLYCSHYSSLKKRKYGLTTVIQTYALQRNVAGLIAVKL